MGRVTLRFDKLYRYDRILEPCSIAVPLGEGVLREPYRVQIRDGGRVMPSQTRVTSRYQDGSVRYLFVRFLTDLPGNAGKELECVFGSEENLPENVEEGFPEISVEETAEGWVLQNGDLSFALGAGTPNLFRWLKAGSRTYAAEQFVGPVLKRYLKCGMRTFRGNVGAAGSGGGAKRVVEDTVIVGSGGTKSFAQSFLPMAVFYKALVREDML